MNWNRAICSGLIVLMTGILSGCATLVSDRKYEVTMDNSGGPTYFSVYDARNQVVESGVTPKQVTLKANANAKLFRKSKYSVVFAGRDGVDQQTLHGKIDWWTAGNIIIGGLPGLAIDTMSGAVWRLDSRVTGQVPAEMLVSNRTHGAAVLASHSNKNSAFAGHAVADKTTGSNIRQASFGKTNNYSGLR